VATTLVIGGTRNLGPALVAALLERGDTVTTFNRGHTSDDLPAAVERLHGDRADEAVLRAALSRRSFDLVVDTTLYTGEEARSVARLLDGHAGRYVAWSTGNVYLVRTGVTRPFREEDYDGPVMPEPPSARAHDHRNWVYGVDKRAAEDALMAAHAARGFPALVLRMPMINSERDHYGRLAGYVRRLLDGGPLLLPHDGLPVRHVYGGDVIAATLLAGSPAVSPGVSINVSQDETVTLEQVLGHLAAACGRPLVVRRAPREALDAAGLLPDCSPWSDPWMSALANERSKSVLGMRYTPLTRYVPTLVEAARLRPAASLASYAQRPAELAFAAAQG